MSSVSSLDSFGARGPLAVGETSYDIFRLSAVPGADLLPFSLKVLMENLLRTEDGANITADQIRALAGWNPDAEPDTEIQFTPARVIMQDFTGVPCIVDLATMREAVAELGGDARKVNPLAPAELVIDHSVITDVFGRKDAFERNVELEYQRNGERYQFLRWGQTAFDDFKVVPPGTGIVHQVNIEHLARVIFDRPAAEGAPSIAYPDTCVGTDSHTTMVNGLGVLGWGVGGIEAEAAMLGQPVSMLIPRVVGFKLTGEIPAGATATDVVLTITEQLRKHGVVGKFVEFYGQGVGAVPLANRATIGNMSPEFGSTCAIFPIDDVTLDYLRLTGRSDQQVALVEAYCKEQGLWHTADHEAKYSEYLELDLSSVVPSIAGPKRPQGPDRADRGQAGLPRGTGQLRDAGRADRAGPGAVRVLPGQRPAQRRHREPGPGRTGPAARPGAGAGGQPAPAPAGLGAAGRRHRDRPRPRARGDRLDHLLHQHLQPVGDDRRRAAGEERRRAGPDGQALGEDVAGAGLQSGDGLLRQGRPGAVPGEARLPPGRFTAAPPASVTPARCRKRSRPLSRKNDLAVVSVLSGNRNFEGRINPDVKMNYLASPPLVIAYALAGTMDWDPASEPIGIDPDGTGVYLADIWPKAADVARVVEASITKDMFTTDYADVFAGDERWTSLPTPEGETFAWAEDSTYVRKPPYFEGMQAEPAPVTDVADARVLARLGDSVTTDHISPAGSIKVDSPAGVYLAEHGVARKDFNSYGSRRGNHEVMIRGTFANIRLRNLLLDGVEGGFTRKLPGRRRADHDL